MNSKRRFGHLSEAELMGREQSMRAQAHNAPKSLEGAYNDAYARWAEEWFQLKDEIKSRSSMEEQRPLKA